MKGDVILLVLTLLWTDVLPAHIISKRMPQLPMLRKIDEISRHLRDLTAAMTEFDQELREAVDDGISCRLSLRADFCEALELLREQASYLQNPASPGKRNGGNSASKYRKIVDDLSKKREVLSSLKNLFNNAGSIIEREKKWFTCNLNLGFTCQTQEYNSIADQYDFLSSAASPGRKRSASKESTEVSS